MKTDLIFKLKKIAFNNSCNSNFVSLSFDENTHISGKNGSGKSSKLNGVQLGFLPEVTFKNSKKHFYFKSSKGNYYSDQDCYDFYFPHNNSYIIYEFENPNGVFCQILYKGKNELMIERAFVPLSLKELYNWFWTFPENDELGYPTNIQRTELIEKIKSVQGHQFAKTKKVATELLYNNDFNDDSSKYSIASINENKTENVIDIFKLTSNATEIDNNMLKKTITSLLKTSYQDNNKDQLDYNPVEIMKEFDRLEEEKRVINKRKNLKPEYIKLDNDFKNFISKSKELQEKYQLCYEYNCNVIENNKDRLKELHIEKESAKEKEDSLGKIGREIRSRLNKVEGKIESDDQTIYRLKNKLSEYNEIFDVEHDSGLHMFKNSPESAITYLEDYIQDTKLELKKYNNLDKTFKTLNKDKIILKSKEKELTNLKKQLESDGNLIFSTDKLNNVDVLNSINNSFATLKDDLSEYQIEVLNSLTEIMTKEPDGVYLNGVFFGNEEPYNFSREDAIKAIEELEIETSSLKKEIVKNNNILDSDGFENKEQLEKDLKKAKKEKNIISDGKVLAQSLSETKIDAEKNLKLKKDIEDEINTHVVKYKEIVKLAADKKAEYDILENKIKTANRFKEQLTLLQKKEGFFYIKDNELKDTVQTVTDKDINVIEGLFSDISKGREFIIEGLNKFIDEGIIIDDNNILKTNGILIKDLKSKIFIKIQDIYQSLDENEDSFNKAFRQHSETTLEITNALSLQIDHFKAFEKRLNKSIGEFKLSSIDDMKIKIELEPRIENFINTISEARLLSDDASGILEQGLADKIRNFIVEMGLENKKDMTINTESMIKSVCFKYQVEGVWTDKDGSTGTSTVASVILLSVFIREICGKDIRLSIPVNLDETGNIDYGNMMTLYDFLKKQDLILFSASPEPQISSGDIFKVLINFDDSIVFDKERLMDDKHRSTFHHMMGSLINEIKPDIEVVDFEDSDSDSLDNIKENKYA